jgi:hypothetical protein
MIVVQTNKAFVSITLNLVCSAARVGIPKTQFVIWSVDEVAHKAMQESGLWSYYNPTFFYGSENPENYQYEGS